jgi:polysaccharide export outer membrane protein
MTRTTAATAFIVALLASAPGRAVVQGQAAVPQKPPAVAAQPGAQSGVPTPADYVIGADDVLQVNFWRDKDMTVEVAVRPDGKITLPLLNDVHAAGFTPEQLRDRLTEQAKKYVVDPTVTVVVKQINSRRVFITGEVNKPGMYPLNDRMTVVQLIAMAGGLTEFAKSKDIVIMRSDSGGTIRPKGEPVALPFNYKDFVGRRNLKQNVELKPGDTVIVP